MSMSTMMYKIFPYAVTNVQGIENRWSEGLLSDQEACRQIIGELMKHFKPQNSIVPRVPTPERQREIFAERFSMVTSIEEWTALVLIYIQYKDVDLYVSVKDAFNNITEV